MYLTIDKKESMALKGVSIITVILSHSADIGCLYINRDIFAYFCRGGMAVFLFLSGYGCFASYLENGLNEYWEKKFVKIWYPFLVSQIILHLLAFVINHTYFTLGEYISILFALCKEPPVDGSMWYVNFIFLYYFLFYFSFKLFDMRKALIVFGVISVLAYFYIPEYYSHGGYLSIQFMCGILWRGVEEKFKLKQKICKFIPMILLPLYYVISVLTYNESTELAYIVSVLGTVFFIISMLIVVKLIKHRELLEWIGKKSYFIYLVEAVVIYDILGINYVYLIFGKTPFSVIINFIIIVILARSLEVGVNKLELVSRNDNKV